MNRAERHRCEDCPWADWCDIYDPNNELCEVYGGEVAYEQSLAERVAEYDEEIMEYSDGTAEM